MEFIGDVLKTVCHENGMPILPLIIASACIMFMTVLFFVKLEIFGPGCCTAAETVICYTLHSTAQAVSFFAIWHIYAFGGSFIIIGLFLFLNIFHLCFFVPLCR